MTAWAWVHVLAAASGLTVAALAISRGTGSPLARPLVLLAVDQFAWNAASVGTELTHEAGYAWLGAIAAPLFNPFALDFVLTFLGKRRSLRGALVAAYALYGAQSLLALADWLVPALEVPGGIKTFAMLMLTTSAPLTVVGLALVGRHLRGAATSLERWRARVLLVAIVLVTIFAFTDLLADLTLPVPRLATLGSFAFNALLTHLTLGLGLFAVVPRRSVALGQAVLLGLFVAVSFLALFVLFRERLGVLLTSLTAVSVGFAVLGWLFIAESHRARASLERSATLGRFSTQMAHDLKNPLAAARGAAEYLVEELRRSGAEQQRDFATLIVQQLDRLHAVIERYQRLSKLEPALVDVDLNALVARVLSLQQFAAGANVTLVQELAEPGPRVRADPDLLASALENLVKNASEAMPSGGKLTVRTSLSDAGAGPVARLAVQDTGTGMDARTREQVFEPFFTTKANGSGLGLAFVQQVARAHGGDVTLNSREGSGTLVELALPLSPP